MQKEKKNTTVISIALILVVLALAGGIYLFIGNKDKDALKFKTEYQELNGTTSKSGSKYLELDIDKDNPIKYISAKEALEVLKSDSAIIYAGAPWCPWCRNAVPVILELAKKKKVDTIYYLELDDIKSNFEIEDGELKKTVDGTDDYYELLDALGDRLDDYILKDSDGKEYDTKEKRIYMPYLISVRNGRIVGDKIGTVSLNENQTSYDLLTDEQRKELLDIYGELFDVALGNDSGVCEEDSCN